MYGVSVKFPALEATTAAQAALLPGLPFGGLSFLTGQLLQVVANGLVQAFAHFAGSFTGRFGHARVDGQSDVHGFFLLNRTYYV
jgi:hypothetical protein